MSVVDVQGYCDPAFAPVKEAFLNNFKHHQETGAAVSLVLNGKAVVDLWAGWVDFRKRRPWRSDTLANIYSATKGVTAICAMRLMDQGRLDPDKPVSAYWPEFRGQGKEAITVRMLLNHTAGMVGLRKQISSQSLYNWQTMTAAYAADKPWWTPGEKHGYHALSFGWLLGQVIRNISGLSVGEYLKNEITGPLGLDLHIGLDPEEHHRCATMIMLRLMPSIHKDALRFAGAMVANLNGPTTKAFTNPVSIVTGVNSASWRSSEIPSANGQSTAGALATLYGILANGGRKNGRRILSQEAVNRCSREETNGLDEVLKLPTRFGPGFMLNQDNPSGNFGPGQKSFGHPGAGGAFGFADPEANLGFGYVMNKMDTYILIDPRPRRLLKAAYQCL
ncbi:MAG: serine hydrolase domain-containing protein [Desulfosudaceae bacterium]